MGNSGSVKHTLFRSYIIFTIITVALFVTCLLGGAYSFMKDMQNGPRAFEDKYNDVVSDIANEISGAKDYRSIDVSKLQSLNGWIEIVDIKGQVVYRNGYMPEGENRVRYDQSELESFKYASFNSKIAETIKGRKYYRDIRGFKASDNQYYFLLVNVDHELYSENFTNKMFVEFTKALGFYMVVFLLLFFLNIFIFSRYIGARITNPLAVLRNRIQDVPIQGKQQKIDYNETVEEEFVEIADSFNNMIDEIVRMEEERRVQEEDKQKIIVDISHDIKTPITAIQGYAQAMSDGIIKDEKEKEKYLNTICMKAQSVTELINLLFEYVKLDHKSFQLNYENVDINEVVRRVIAEYYEEITDNNLQLHVDIPEEAIFCSVDIMQIKRVITNLITNSLKYNQNGDKLFIGVRKEGYDAVIRVGDNGVGIPKEIRDSVFEPFVRGENGKQSKASGSGIGLSIVKKVVEMHGGSITLLDEKDDIKSMFEIKIPAFKN